jgi:prolyl oligopeptidase
MVKSNHAYGYGGFNISLTPSFSIANAVWMENGAFTLYLTCEAAENMEKNADAGTTKAKCI